MSTRRPATHTTNNRPISRREFIMNMALQMQERDNQKTVQRWLADQCTENTTQSSRPIRKRNQIELGQEYYLSLSKNRRQRRAETPKANVVTATIVFYLIRHEKTKNFLMSCVTVKTYSLVELSTTQIRVGIHSFDKLITFHRSKILESCETSE